MEKGAKKPRMLVIEDNLDTRNIYKDVFEQDGFSVLLAEDGEKGLSYAQSTLPDVILLDLMLPKISGFDLLARLRAKEETRRIPVMIFSARDATADLKQAGDPSITDFSAKALNSPKQMVGRVRALMARAVKQPEPPKTASGVPEVFLKESMGDAPRLAAALGLADGFRCPECRGDVALQMRPDPTRDKGHWYAAHFVCSLCRWMA